MSQEQSQSQIARQNLTKEIMLNLGGGMIDLELDPGHYDLAITKSLDRYKQRSTNSMEDSFSFLELQPEQQVFYLPQEIITIRRIYRRGVGGTTTGGGTYLDPVSLAYNNLYLLKAGGQGGLATYDFYMQYLETVGKMFGQYITYSWNPDTKRLQLHRKFTGPETVLIEHHNAKPDFILITGTYSRSWIRDYSIAQCKLMLGEARSLFSNIAGPQGGSSLNGDAMKQEALQEIERLDAEMENQKEGPGAAYGFVIG